MIFQRVIFKRDVSGIVKYFLIFELLCNENQFPSTRISVIWAK
uniref:Uncharacterized protein n=1 Tax=Anguilla anguilla TaxID=7936 RepID=A0A0E9U3F4_ANGAN